MERLVKATVVWWMAWFAGSGQLALERYWVGVL
jgi:hypothetical protein